MVAGRKQQLILTGTLVPSGQLTIGIGRASDLAQIRCAHVGSKSAGSREKLGPKGVPGEPDRLKLGPSGLHNRFLRSARPWLRCRLMPLLLLLSWISLSSPEPHWPGAAGLLM